MKISVLTIGSRGDVQPYVAIAVELQTRGHEVTVACAAYHEQFVTSKGLKFVPLHYRAQVADPVIESFTPALLGADLVVAAASPFLVAGPYCERHDIPLIPAYLQAINRGFESPVNRKARPGSNEPGDAAPIDDKLVEAFGLKFWFHLWKQLNVQRRELGLPPNPPSTDFVRWLSNGVPILYGFSRLVVPPSEWGHAPSQVTGYWFLDLVTGWEPPQDLLDFLDDGPPPIHIGFSTVHYINVMPPSIIIEALKRTGQRAVMIPNLVDLKPDDLPPNVFLIKDIPYEWLLARCAATINHAGHGTIANALQAGTPTVPMPTGFDQFYWADCAHRLGAATKPLLLPDVTVEKLTDAIMQAVEDKDMKRCAVNLSQGIRAEDGVGTAASAIESYLR